MMIASAATCWVVADSRVRGQPLLHILQLLTFMLWPIAVPIYVFSTRGIINGIGWFVTHVVGLGLAVGLGSGITALIHGIGAFPN